MFSRRNFVSSLLTGTAGLTLAPLLTTFSPKAAAQNVKPATGKKTSSTRKHYKLAMKDGMGGAPLGSGGKWISNAQAIDAVEGAWNAGVRYFDTSPFYGFGLSERRFGAFLSEKKRSDYVLSTKIGRVFKPSKQVEKKLNWYKPSPFDYTYDYSAAGTRRSIEDSLQRLGIESIDVVFIHDLIPETEDIGPKWAEYFEIAKKGAMPELTKMREEGIIKAWGLGVNSPMAILQTLDSADPDVMLAATQYSLMKHEEALNKTFPACEARDVAIIVGAPLNNGFISGADRYDYGDSIPAGMKEKRTKMMAVAKEFGVDLRTAGLQFCAAHPAVTAVIPGCRNAEQAIANHKSMSTSIPADFWKKMKQQKLIAENAPTK